MKVRDDDRLRSKLVDYVQDAHAMELSVTLMLESMIKAAEDAKTKEMLQSHLEQTKEQKLRMEERLEVLDSHRSLRKTGEAMVGRCPRA